MPAATNPAGTAGNITASRGFLASGLGIALFSSAVFGISGSFAKALLETGWSPGAAVTARLTGAALILAIPALPALRGRWHQLRDNWPGPIPAITRCRHASRQDGSAARGRKT